MGCIQLKKTQKGLDVHNLILLCKIENILLVGITFEYLKLSKLDVGTKFAGTFGNQIIIFEKVPFGLGYVSSVQIGWI